MSQGRIHFGKSGREDTWTWRAGRETVVIRDPKRKKFAVPMTKITGCSWEEIGKMRYKGGRSACAVTPKKVRKYIERKLRKA